MSKLFDLSGKVALVTGASSGLGAHFAHKAVFNNTARSQPPSERIAFHTGEEAINQDRNQAGMVPYQIRH